MVKSFLNHPRLAWARTEEGQTVIEYVLVIVLISLVIIFAFFTTGVKDAITQAASDIAACIDSSKVCPYD
jgi:Flp pilus assembly pilin Flp